MCGAPPAVAQSGLDYLGLEPGVQLAAFLEQLGTVASRDAVVCQTSPRTAHIMECGVPISDPAGHNVYLSLHSIGGTVAMVAVTDEGGARLIEAWRDRLRAQFGDGTATRRHMVQWVHGDTVARLTWRGTAERQRVSLTIAHDPTIAKINDYLP